MIPLNVSRVRVIREMKVQFYAIVMMGTLMTQKRFNIVVPVTTSAPPVINIESVKLAMASPESSHPNASAPMDTMTMELILIARYVLLNVPPV